MNTSGAGAAAVAISIVEMECVACTRTGTVCSIVAFAAVAAGTGIATVGSIIVRLTRAYSGAFGAFVARSVTRAWSLGATGTLVITLWTP